MAAARARSRWSTTTTPLTGACPPAPRSSTSSGTARANDFEGSGPTPILSNTTAALRTSDGCDGHRRQRRRFRDPRADPRNTASPIGTCGGPRRHRRRGRQTRPRSPPAAKTLLTVTMTPGANPPSTGLARHRRPRHDRRPGPTPLFDDGTNGDVAAGDLTFSPATRRGRDALRPARGHLHDLRTPRRSTPPRRYGQRPGGAASPIHKSRARRNLALAGQRSRRPRDRHRAAHERLLHAGPEPRRRHRDLGGHLRLHQLRPGGQRRRLRGVSGTVRSSARAGDERELDDDGARHAECRRCYRPETRCRAVVVGTGGRIPPDTVIEDDATGGVETSGVFDPTSDGIDFYESLEGMRVQLNNAVAVGPTRPNSARRPVIGDDGASASVRTYRGGHAATPRRLQPGARHARRPDHTAAERERRRPLQRRRSSGSWTTTSATSSRSPTAGSSAIHDGVSARNDRSRAAGAARGRDIQRRKPRRRREPSKFNALAGLIVNNLRSPDIIARRGGAGQQRRDQQRHRRRDSQTLTQLVAAIQAAGGPTYECRQIDPVNGQDGGEPGGNIRQVFLFRADRGLAFVDRPGGDSTTPKASSARADDAAAVQPWPHRPDQPRLDNSRKPLAGEFVFRGHPLFVIANHFNSKGGDQPLFGRFQPPARARKRSGTSRRRSRTTSSSHPRPPTRTRTWWCSAT